MKLQNIIILIFIEAPRAFKTNILSLHKWKKNQKIIFSQIVQRFILLNKTNKESRYYNSCDLNIENKGNHVEFQYLCMPNRISRNC